MLKDLVDEWFIIPGLLNALAMGFKIEGGGQLLSSTYIVQKITHKKRVQFYTKSRT